MFHSGFLFRQMIAQKMATGLRLSSRLLILTGRSSINRNIQRNKTQPRFNNPVGSVGCNQHLPVTIINPSNCHQIIRNMSSSSSSDEIKVEHDPSNNKFFIPMGKDEAKLEYVKEGDVLDMWHTEVPPMLQGRGIAKILAQEAFDYVRKNNLKMRLSCTYLQKYYRENPKAEYKKLVV